MLEVYTEGVRDADAMLGRLVDLLRRAEEPVVLVFFGDHLPYLGDNQKGYAELGSEVSIPENEREDISLLLQDPLCALGQRRRRGYAELERAPWLRWTCRRTAFSLLPF
ncbi:MAG: sulfatase-like hydrolase/transferase [Dysosmobacter sp.]